MRRISIERYQPTTTIDVQIDSGPVSVEPITDHYSGVVEGERDDGTMWIMFLDQNGSPKVFWTQRDELGGVCGVPIALDPDDESVDVVIEDEDGNVLDEDGNPRSSSG